MWCFGLLITWCAMQTPAPAGDTYCMIARPIYWSSKDTRETKAQADRENAKWKARCSSINQGSASK